jgi:hypothetical protein
MAVFQNNPIKNHAKSLELRLALLVAQKTLPSHFPKNFSAF